MTTARTRPLLALAAIAVFAFCACAPALAAGSAPSGQPAKLMEATPSQITSFYFGKNDLITPVPPFNETAGQKANALGVTFPRALLSNIGTWGVTLVEEGMSIESVDTMSIWASSDQGASNVRFIVNIEINGNNIAQLATETKATVGATPEEFRVNPASGTITPQVFPKGARLGFNVQYSSGSSHGPIGPSSDSVFHYYGNLYRSRIDFITSPFNLTLESVRIGADRVNATTIVKDAFGVDAAQRTISVTFNGPTNSMAHHVKLVNTITDSVNGTQLVWEWEFARQGGVSSGAYAISVSAQYAGSEVNYSNVSTLTMEFPAVRDEEAPGPAALEVVGAVAAAAVAIAALRSAPPRRKG